MARGAWLCDDWTCPSAQSCARHFGRSQAYAAMSLNHPPLAQGRRWAEIDGRLVQLDACADFKIDGPHPWLIPYDGQAFADPAGVLL